MKFLGLICACFAAIALAIGFIGATGNDIGLVLSPAGMLTSGLGIGALALVFYILGELPGWISRQTVKPEELPLPRMRFLASPLGEKSVLSRVARIRRERLRSRWRYF